MSAYIVSDNHISVIVSYFVDPRHGSGLWHKMNGKYDYLSPENAAALAYQLWAENVKSVNARYRETTADEGYRFKYIPLSRDYYSISEIAGALDCLEYQSCEHDDYHQSEAWDNLNMMRKHLLRQLQDREQGDETTWHIGVVKSRRVAA